MNREERKAYLYVLKILGKIAPTALVAAGLNGAVMGSRPFIAIWLSGLLIDAVYKGAGMQTLVAYALWAIGAVLMLSLLDSMMVKIENQCMEYMYEQQNGPLSKKSMQMDYEYLEDAKVHNMRETVTSFYPRFGLLGMVQESVRNLMNVTFTILAAVAIVVPKLIAGAHEAKGTIGSLWFSGLFLAIIVAITVVNMKLLNICNGRLQKLYQGKKAPLDTKKRYYLDLFAKAESQKDVRMCRQGELILHQMDELSEEAFREKKTATRIAAKRGAVSDLLSAFTTLLVYAFAGVYGWLGIISIGSVVSFSASIRKVADSVFTFGEVFGDIKYESGFAVQYREFMSLHQRKHEGTIPVEKRRDNKFSVEFDHVSFKYPGSDTYVIRDLNLSFVIGEKMAIVGKNGSGKTTFIKLLCRLYDVTEGCIRVNGIDIRKYDYREYCDLFSVVFQDFTIFDFALAESVACGVDWEEARIMDALNRAGLSERSKELPKGLLTVIGKGFDDEGVNFSGGEKQKLAIARAIYKDAPFVIMDEPTAALDPEAEAEVFAGFDKMVGKKTALYISHRLASCRFCEDILVFDKGQVVQRGSHEELEQQEGLYQKLWNAQAQYYA